MKNLIWVAVFSCCIASCKKNSTPATPVNPASCRIVKIFTSSGGTNNTKAIEYDNAGKLISLKEYNSTTLVNSTIIGNSSTQSKYTSSSGFDMIQDITYDGDLFLGQLPIKESISRTEGLITTVNVFTYYFYYDSKDRINRVRQETPNVLGDWEFEYFISYNDQDNVTAITNKWFTGPNTSTTIIANGYDDKPNPYSDVRFWKYWVSWDYAYLLFAQLSKNNPLGFTLVDGTKKTFTYEYNDKGFPVKNISVNTTASGSTATAITTMDYTCQ
jgi:hypothetical protein